MTSADLFSLMVRLFPGAVRTDRETIGRIGREPGAYALLLRLETPVEVCRPRIHRTTLAGWYVYAGSARGSGGIRARLEHHFCGGKPVHWHVDQLTNAATDVAALAMADWSECQIVHHMLHSGLFASAIRGFGNSDCTRCETHLLASAPPKLEV